MRDRLLIWIFFIFTVPEIFKNIVRTAPMESLLIPGDFSESRKCSHKRGPEII